MTIKTLTSNIQVLDWLTVVGICVMVGIAITGVLSYGASAHGILYWSIYSALVLSLIAGFILWDNYSELTQNYGFLLVLSAIGIAIMWMVNFQGLVWFILMPITMQAVIFMTRRQVIVYTTGLVLLMNLIAYLFVFNGTVFSLWLTNTLIIGGMYAVGLVTQISLVEQLRASQEIERLNQQLRDYAIQSAELATAQERNRMAHTLHDSIGHTLTVVSVQLEAAERLIEHEKYDKATHAIQIARQVTREGLRDVRDSVQSLRTDTHQLDSKLSDALEALLSWSVSDKRDVNLQSTPETLNALNALPHRTQSILLSAIQEGLTNALKHSEATLIALHIQKIPECIRLTLTNDAPKSVAGYGNKSGLKTMRDRVKTLNGIIETTLSDSTFTLMIEIPL